MLRTWMEEPFKEATRPSSPHQTSKPGWPQGEGGWLLVLLPSQNGYLRVRFPHAAGSQSALAWSWRRRRSQEAKSGRNSKVGRMLTE